jgi:hypothetical protein
MFDGESCWFHSCWLRPPGRRRPISKTVDLDNADIHLNAGLGLVPNQGVVYRQLQYQINKPAWFGSSTQRTLELAER